MSNEKMTNPFKSASCELIWGTSSSFVITEEQVNGLINQIRELRSDLELELKQSECNHEETFISIEQDEDGNKARKEVCKSCNKVVNDNVGGGMI